MHQTITILCVALPPEHHFSILLFKRNCFLPISVSSPLYWVCLTGIQIKDYDYVAVNQENDRVMFRNMDLYYKRGIPYFGEVSS